MRTTNSIFILFVIVATLVTLTALVQAQSRGCRGDGCGACCFPDGSCTETEQGLCENAGGEFQGGATGCANPTTSRGSVICPVIAINDECEDAIRIDSNDIVSGTINGATPSDALNCAVESNAGPAGGQPDVWYSVIGTGGYMEAELCIPDEVRIQQTGQIHVYCGGCSGLNCVAGVVGNVYPCDLDRASVNSLGEDELEVEWCSEIGREYLIRVAYGSLPGARNHLTEFILEVESKGESCEPEPCARNDFCEDAQPICPGIVYTGDTFTATNDYLDHGAPINTVFFCGALMALYDVWYSYTPAEAGLLFVHVEQLPTEWVFGVYDDCPENGGVLLKCNITRHHGVIVVPVQPFQTYYIRIAGFLESRGEFFMDILGPGCAFTN